MGSASGGGGVPSPLPPAALHMSPCIARCPKDVPCFALYSLGSAPRLPHTAKILAPPMKNGITVK